MTEFFVDQLIKTCIEARKNAYAKYSGFSVGALVVDERDRVFVGVNVENVSYGLTLCAERNAIFSAVAQGMKRIKILCVVADTKEPVTPCGACRQVLLEFSDENTKVILANLDKKYQIISVSQLLPYAFEMRMK